jgi:hypothetical protein
MAQGESQDKPVADRRKQRRRRNGTNAAAEAQTAGSAPIANWQATFAWTCASWGLIPVIGLLLGVLGLVFGLLGWRRVRRRPEDLGVRHAIGGMILGAIEIVVNVIGTTLVVIGILELRS